MFFPCVYKQKFLRLQKAATLKLINYTLSKVKTYACQNTKLRK